MRHSATLRASALLLAAGLSPATAQFAGTVDTTSKISATTGGFTGDLDAVDLFGTSVARLGDLDGDGRPEVAVGAQLDDDGGFGRGAVWILTLQPDGSVAKHQKISQTAGGFTGQLQDFDVFGWAVASLGDLDGDGVPDMASSAWHTSDDAEAAGAVWILFLRPDGTVAGHQKIDDDEGGFTGQISASDHFGTSLACLGDLDGDGVQDLAVGALYDDSTTPGDGGFLHGDQNQGAEWIVFMNADGTVRDQTKIANDTNGFGNELAYGDRFGYATASLGDLDGDGTTDIAVSAVLDDAGCFDCGAVYVLFLEPDGTVGSYTKIAAGLSGFDATMPAASGFGRAIANLGDLDGDGVVDIAVGAPGDDLLGSVWVLFLRPDGTVRAHVEIAEGLGGFGGDLEIDDIFGGAIGSLGDLDDDGRLDLAIGAMGDDDGGEAVGAVWLVDVEFSPWLDRGGASAGAGGTPTLTPEGPLVGATSVDLALAGAAQAAPAGLVVGLDVAAVPFKGGLLVPSSTIVLSGLVTDARGAWSVSAPWPTGLPSGWEIVFQFAVVDPTSIGGVALSNGASATVP